MEKLLPGNGAYKITEEFTKRRKRTEVGSGSPSGDIEEKAKGREVSLGIAYDAEQRISENAVKNACRFEDGIAVIFWREKAGNAGGTDSASGRTANWTL